MKYQLYIKLTSIFLLLAILLCFASCSKDNEDGEKLKYYTPYQSTDITEIIERYNKYCKNNLDESYQIEIVEYDSLEEMYTTMATEIMSGDGPDIISLDQPLPFEKLIENHAFADVDELINTYGSNIDFNDYNTKVMESGIVNRKRCFVPFFYCPNIFISTQEKLKE